MAEIVGRAPRPPQMGEDEKRARARAEALAAKMREEAAKAAEAAPPPGAVREVQREREREKMGIAYDRAPMEARKKGGYIKAADGIAQRGKTRGMLK